MWTSLPFFSLYEISKKYLKIWCELKHSSHDFQFSCNKILIKPHQIKGWRSLPVLSSYELNDLPWFTYQRSALSLPELKWMRSNKLSEPFVKSFPFDREMLQCRSLWQKLSATKINWRIPEANMKLTKWFNSFPFPSCKLTLLSQRNKVVSQ